MALNAIVCFDFKNDFRALYFSTFNIGYYSLTFGHSWRLGVLGFEDFGALEAKD